MLGAKGRREGRERGGDGGGGRVVREDKEERKTNHATIREQQESTHACLAQQ